MSYHNFKVGDLVRCAHDYFCPAGIVTAVTHTSVKVVWSAPREGYLPHTEYDYGYNNLRHLGVK